VIIEAMTAGLPVLVTDICGYAHHVKEANAGVLVGTPFKQSELNSALFEMLTTSSDHWSKNALKYTTKLMHSNPSQFEANFLIATTKKKSKKYEVI
jgi:UDP-glucose:(heptosyl)LPS alpha-1,3-glucosyltransferase